MERKELENLVSLADELDQKGLVEEAAALDKVLTKVAATEEEEKGMTGKATHALEVLCKTCESFCAKNLDTRGSKRRLLNQICDLAEDCAAKCREILGEKKEEQKE